LKVDYGAEFKMRFGINSGLVMVGAIGNDLRMDYTADGDYFPAINSINAELSLNIKIIFVLKKESIFSETCQLLVNRLIGFN